jgi:hypothetical protein
MDEVSAANFVAGRGIEGVLDGPDRLVFNGAPSSEWPK